MNQVIIYTSPTCPKCEILKTKFKNKNIEYREINEYKTLIELGITEVPIVSINGVKMDFVTANNWCNNYND